MLKHFISNGNDGLSDLNTSSHQGLHSKLEKIEIKHESNDTMMKEDIKKELKQEMKNNVKIEVKNDVKPKFQMSVINETFLRNRKEIYEGMTSKLFWLLPDEFCKEFYTIPSEFCSESEKLRIENNVK